MKLKEKSVLVTGAGRGIGRAISEQCAAEGARVALLSRTASQLDEVAAGITASGGTARAYPTDVSDWSQVGSAVDQIKGDLGSVDVLINNAGSFNTIGPAWETDPESWWQDVMINIRGTHHCCRAVLPGMVSRKSGRVINLIGGGTSGPFPWGSGYATSKAAVMRYTECLAMELSDQGIFVFAMGPGLVRTAMTELQLNTQAGQKWMGSIKDRFEKGADVPPTLAAELAVELASGRFDRLSGRSFQAGEDLDVAERDLDTIIRDDLRTLRMR